VNVLDMHHFRVRPLIPTPGQDAQAVARAPVPPAPGEASLSGIVARLTSVNVFVLGLGLLTAPLMARALGPEGRGAYAAVLAPLALAPSLLTFGLPVFAAREAADKVAPGRIFGSIAPFMIVVSVVCVGAAPWIADHFGQGRSEVRDPLLAGFVLSPILLLSAITYGVVSGQQRWNRVIASRLAAALTGAVGIVTFYVLGRLTVSAAAYLFIAGSLLAAVPTASALRGHGRFVYDRRLARRALRFGPAAWLWQTGALANARIDQLLMVTMTSARQLGLYAIAVTIGNLCNVFIAAIGPALLPRMVEGGKDLTPRAFRTTVFLTLFGVIPIGVAAPFVVPVLFGPAFADAVPMVWILLLAALPAAGRYVLTSALIASSLPRWAAIAEGSAVVVTVTGLLVLLPSLGGLGAALVSLVAYTVALLILLFAVRRELALPLSAFLTVQSQDVAVVARRLRTSATGAASALRGRQTRRRAAHAPR
jgi:O-antigen/teichoic acid export membrane protein